MTTTTKTSKPIQIGIGYSASGYGRGVRNGKKIYLINGKAYARDKERAKSSFEPCTDELASYVRVNKMNGFDCKFYQVGRESEHDDYIVKSVNNYDKMLTLLTELRDGDYSCITGAIWTDIDQTIKAAIKNN